MRAVLVVGVIACLCFSAGEGLRLTPLPSPPPAEEVTSNLQAEVTLARGASLNRTGPLDMPAQGQAQKRGKRQSTDCECPPVKNTLNPNDGLPRDPGVLAPVSLTSALPISEPPDRGPPSFV